MAPLPGFGGSVSLGGFQCCLTSSLQPLNECFSLLNLNGFWAETFNEDESSLFPGKKDIQKKSETVIPFQRKSGAELEINQFCE